jgi:hypothetical protein
MTHQLQFVRAWLAANRGEYHAILLAIALAAAALLIAVYVGFPPAGSSTSFGPGWECTQVPNGQPVCVKKVAPASPGSQQ